MRLAATAVLAAALLPLTGTAHASCLDDFNTGLHQGYAESPKSPRYQSLSYVDRSGPLTVSVYGDLLVADALARVGDSVRWTQITVTNAPGAATAFAGCVAG
ncbi:MAG TPA: hypothetical protein VGX28_13100 [Frankiaceae bacterium]|jgi:hypothetical protein|nr:hypothetical protein [Frankiaceae bacterium]